VTADGVTSPADDLPSAVGTLARALAEVRRETGTEAIELRGRFRTIEQRLSKIEQQQARILAMLEAETRRPAARSVKEAFTPEEIAEIRRQKLEGRGAGAATTNDERGADQAAETGPSSSSKAKQASSKAKQASSEAKRVSGPKRATSARAGATDQVA
jgi:hypothetical protein